MIDPTDSPPGGHQASVLVAKASKPRSSTMKPAEFAAVYREHYGFVWRILRRMGLPMAMVEDAAQDVFLVVHRRWHDFDRSRSLRSWLFGIARRVAADARRGELRRGRRLRALPEPPSGPNPEGQAARARAARFVERFLAKLSPEQATCFTLMDIEGLTAPEVAEALDIPLNTVYSRLRAARRRFERTLARQQKKGEGHG